MSDETRLLAEARRLLAEHDYRYDEALMSTIRRAQAAEVKFGVLYADYERLTAKVDQHHIPGAVWEDRAHAAEQSLGEADAEIERLKAIVRDARRDLLSLSATLLRASYGEDVERLSRALLNGSASGKALLDRLREALETP